MPTTPRKARILLKEGKAVVLGRKPFIIKLNYQTTNFIQSITLGIDPGYKHLGLSAITNKKEVYAAEVQLRTDIVKLIAEKRMYRKVKRNKLWYRQPRFLNRGIKKEWFAPSIQHKLDSIIRIIGRIHALLPVSKIMFEKANFDIQKIKNPEIDGTVYQNGEQKDFENTRKYVLFRDNYICQNCKKEDVKFHVHHIIGRQNGGNRPDNLITLCEKCHGLVHEGKIELKVKRTNGYKAESFMNTVRNKIIEKLREKYNVQETFGYLTDIHRKELGIDKTHNNDAFCITNGVNQLRNNVLYYFQKRRNNRCLQVNRKGYKPSIRRQRYKLQPKDLVKYNDKSYLISGMHGYGKYIYLDDGTKKAMKDKLHIKSELVNMIKYASGIYLII
jgi:hypothetical protein